MSSTPASSTSPPQPRRPGRSIAKWILGIGILLTAAGVVIVLWNSHSSASGGDSITPPETAANVTLTPEQRSKIHLQTIEPSTFHKTVETTGTVDFDNDQATTVLAPFGGPVSKLLVSLGQHVDADQPLAMVDSPDFATAISTYRKAIVTARVARQIADLDKQLVGHRAIAQRDYEQAELNAATAEADREASLAALISLKADPLTLKAIQEGKPFSPVQAVIRSPVAGTVVEKLITPGQLLVAGTTPCFTVADLSRVWVMAHLFGSDLSSVSLGDSAQVLTGINSQTLPGTVGNISALVNPDTRSVAVRVVVKNPGGFLKKGMYVRVAIEAKRESSGLLLPSSAVLRDEQNLPFVYLAQPDGSFARRDVTLGYRAGDKYDITQGIAKGDQVVVEGGLFVQFTENQ